MWNSLDKVVNWINWTGNILFIFKYKRSLYSIYSLHMLQVCILACTCGETKMWMCTCTCIHTWTYAQTDTHTQIHVYEFYAGINASSTQVCFTTFFYKHMAEQIITESTTLVNLTSIIFVIINKFITQDYQQWMYLLPVPHPPLLPLLKNNKKSKYCINWNHRSILTHGDRCT